MADRSDATGIDRRCGWDIAANGGKRTLGARSGYDTCCARNHQMVDTSKGNAPEKFSSFFGVAPLAKAQSSRAGVHAALWRLDYPEAREIGSELDSNTNIVSVHLKGGARVAHHNNNRLKFRGQVAPKMLNLVRSGDRSRKIIESGSLEFIHIYISNDLLRMCANEMETASSFELREACFEEEGHLAALAQTVCTEMRDGLPASSLALDAIAAQIAIHLLRYWSNLRGAARLATPIVRGALAPWQLKRIKEYLLDQIDRDVSLDELRSLVGLSTSHLCTGFRLSTGLPPHQWQIAQRIEKAKDLLRDPSNSITEVSLLVGYSNPGHFATLFRRATGFSPRMWRRQNILFRP